MQRQRPVRAASGVSAERLADAVPSQICAGAEELESLAIKSHRALGRRVLEQLFDDVEGARSAVLTGSCPAAFTTSPKAGALAAVLVAAQARGQGRVEFGDHGPDAREAVGQVGQVGVPGGVRTGRDGDLVNRRADPVQPGIPCRTHDRSLEWPRHDRGGFCRARAGTIRPVAGPIITFRLWTTAGCVWTSRGHEVFSPHTRWTV